MESIQSKIGRVNETLRPLIADSRLALKGERDFGVEMVRALAAVISEMDPIMSNAREFRSKHPEIARDLDVYVEQATDLKTLLEQLRVCSSPAAPKSKTIALTCKPSLVGLTLSNPLADFASLVYRRYAIPRIPLPVAFCRLHAKIARPTLISL
jgi:hypothetical protein